MPDIQHVSPGDPLQISASAWNAVLDAAEKVDPEYLGKDGMGPLRQSLRGELDILVRNDTSGDLSALSVLAIGTATPLVSINDAPHFANKKPTVSGTAPAAATDPFVVTLDPIARGAVGRGVLLGGVVVDINVTDAAHGFAAPAAGDTAKLASGTSGPAKVVWKDSGTGVKRAFVILSGQSSGSAAVSAWKEPVRVATTAAGTLASSFENGDSVDGVTLATGDRILIKNQASATENGIYTVNASGSPTRATDADAGSKLLGAVTYVSEGTINADTVWACTTNATITMGATSLSFLRLAPGTDTFLARLTTSSGGKWKWFKLTLDGSGTFVDDGSEAASFNATPAPIDGTNLCTPATGLRVWMRASAQAGLFEFLPIGYADSTHPGLVSIASQTFAGDKTFSGKVHVTSNAGFDLEVDGEIQVAAGINASGGNIAAGAGGVSGLALTATSTDVTSARDVLVNRMVKITGAGISDASASNMSIYYSTTQNKLVFKDGGGTVNPLY